MARNVQSPTRGDIFWVRYKNDSEKIGVIISDDFINKEGSAVIVCFCTTEKINEIYKNEVDLTINNLPLDCKLLTDEIHTVNKNRLRKKLGSLNDSQLKEVNLGLRYTLALV